MHHSSVYSGSSSCYMSTNIYSTLHEWIFESVVHFSTTGTGRHVIMMHYGNGDKPDTNCTITTPGRKHWTDSVFGWTLSCFKKNTERVSECAQYSRLTWRCSLSRIASWCCWISYSVSQTVKTQSCLNWVRCSLINGDVDEDDMMMTVMMMTGSWMVCGHSSNVLCSITKLVYTGSG